MVNINVKIWVPKKNYSIALENLNNILEPTRVQQGCISCHVYQGLEKNPPIMLVEEWEGEEQLNKYIHSEDFKVILAMMELSKVQPEFTINTVTETKGIESLDRFERLN